MHTSAFTPNWNIIVCAAGLLSRTFFCLCQTQTNINKHRHNGIKLLTSSGVSLVSGWAWAARRAMAPARILLRLIWRSGGGPPRGWPRTMMAQPDKTWRDDNQDCQLGIDKISSKSIGHHFFGQMQIISGNTRSSCFLKSIHHKKDNAIHRPQTSGTNTTPQHFSHLCRRKKAFSFYFISDHTLWYIQ